MCKKAQISKKFHTVRTVGMSLSAWLILHVGKQEHCVSSTGAGMWKFVKRTKRGESPADQQCCGSSVSKETTAATKVSFVDI